MKKVLFLFALCLTLHQGTEALATKPAEQPDYVIIEDAVMLLTANHYMSALSVTVRILDGNNQVLAVVQTSPGQTESLNATGHERKAVFVYDMGFGQTNYIIEDVVH